MVVQVLTRYQALLDKLGESERGRLQRSMGMKMEQLKARRSLLLPTTSSPLCSLMEAWVPSAS